MKLSEIDKSKLPVKVVSTDDDDPTVFTIKYLSHYLAVLEFGNGYETQAPIHLDIWSLYEEPKQKVALYRFKGQMTGQWNITTVYCLNDEDFKNEHPHIAYTAFERVLWSEVEV